MEYARDSIVNMAYGSLTKKPLVVQIWSGENDALIRVNTMPVWVKFPELLVRYWSEKSLSAISSILGKPVMSDRITKDRTWLNFARVLIEVELSTEVVEMVHFVNEYGQLVD